MKLLLLVGCLVVGALGGALYPAAGGLSGGVGGIGSVGGVGGIGSVGGVGGIGSAGGVGGVGVGVVPGPGVGRAAGAERHWINTANAAQQHSAEVQDHGRTDGNYGDSAARAAAKAQQAGSNYGSQASNWDQNNRASKRVADQAAASSWDANKWGERNDANRALNDQIWAQGNQWYKGRRNNDNIDYAYDKKFDLRDSENGGFVFSDSENSHALDDVRDRAAAYDRNVDKDAAWASAADAQKADRKSAWAQNAAAGDSSWDKFARKSANAASANGHSKDLAQKLDQSQGANRQWHDARKTASDIYKDLATADGSYKRNAKAFGGRGGAYGDNVYAYGLAGAGGVAAKPGYYQPDGRVGYAKGGAAGDAAQAWDQAAKLGLRQTEGAASEDNTKAAYSRDQWINDRVKGFDRKQKAASDDKGFSDWARQSAKAANKYDAASADAASKWNKDQSRSRFNEDLWKKEAEKKRLSDRDHNKKVYKKWFNNKNRGGDNWERLKYDRNQNDDAFGYETAAKKDWAQRASDNRWNERYDANARDSKAARAASAARDASNSDWKKQANGWQNANAATSQRDGASRRGYNNEQWKKNQLKDVRDARAQNTGQWHLGADRAAGASGGVVGRAVGGAVGGAVGVVGGAGYPAGGYPAGGYRYGYPVNGGFYGGSPRGYGSGYGYGYAPKGGYRKGYHY